MDILPKFPSKWDVVGIGVAYFMLSNLEFMPPMYKKCFATAQDIEDFLPDTVESGQLLENVFGEYNNFGLTCLPRGSKGADLDDGSNLKYANVNPDNLQFLAQITHCTGDLRIVISNLIGSAQLEYYCIPYKKWSTRTEVVNGVRKFRLCFSKPTGELGRGRCGARRDYRWAAKYRLNSFEEFLGYPS